MTVDLMPEWTIGDLPLTSYPYGVDADSTVDIGEPEMVVETITSNLDDGDYQRLMRHGNRTYVLEVYVEGATLGELAASEATLRSELRQTGLTLTHDPGDGFTPASVYEVQVAQLTPQRQDDHESHLIRKFTLTLTCAPFARSAELTVVPAVDVAAGAAAVVVDACTSTTGWGAGAGDTLSVDVAAGAVQTTLPTPNPGHQRLELVRGAAVDMSAHAYLTVVWRAYTAASATPNPGVAVAQLWADGVQVAEVARIRVDVPGSTGAWYQSWYARSALPNGFAVRLPVSPASSTIGSLSVAEVKKTNEWPGVSPRQVSRLVEVGGTERTPASLHAFTDSGPLGRTIVHTTPAADFGYAPALSRYNVAGNDTTPNLDPTYITGGWQSLQPGSLVARVPASAFPRGDYILMAAMRSSAPGEQAISYAVKSVTSSLTVVGNVTGSTHYAFPTANKMEFVPIAAVSAPVVRSEGEALQIEVHLSNPVPGATNLDVEEWWLFADGPESALSIVGTTSSHMWLDSADVSSSVPRVWVGDTTSRSHPNTGLIAQGTHTFKPGSMVVTVISDSNDRLKAELSYFKRWHSNAAE